MNVDYFKRKICNKKFFNTYFKDFQVNNHELKDVFNPVIFKYDNRFKNHLPVYRVNVEREEGNKDYFYIYFSDFYICIGKINKELPNSIFEYFYRHYQSISFENESCPFSYLPNARHYAANDVWLGYFFTKFTNLIQKNIRDMDDYWTKKHLFKKEIGKNVNKFAVTIILSLRYKLPLEIIYIILEKIKIIDMLYILE